MKDLHKFGLKGQLPLFIQKFLSDRTFNVRIGNTLSDIFKKEQGVPRGNILSPTLFSIKINDIVKCVKDIVLFLLTILESLLARKIWKPLNSNSNDV